MLRKVTLSVLGILLATLAVWGQKKLSPQEYAAEFKRGYDTLVAGKLDEGIAIYKVLLEINPTDVRALSLTSGALKDQGQTERALEWSERALALDPDDMSALINGACLHASLGHKDRALDLLEKALTRRWAKRDWIENDRDYDSLRDEPRFQRLMAQLE